MPSPGDLPNPGMKSGSPALQADSLPAELPGKPVSQMILPKIQEDLILVFLKLLQNTEENKTLTHSFSETNITKRMIPKKNTKMKIIGEYLLRHLNRWLNGKEFKHQCKR